MSISFIPIIHWYVLIFQYPVQAVLGNWKNFPILQVPAFTTDLSYNSSIDLRLSSVYVLVLVSILESFSKTLKYGTVKDRTLEQHTEH